MKKIIITIVTIALIVFFAFYYLSVKNIEQKEVEVTHFSSKEENFTGIIRALGSSVKDTDISYEKAIEIDGKMEDLVSHIVDTSDVDFFKEMYNWFKSLQTYEDYKKYTEKYPELLPVIYAVRLKDKEMYLKFYAYLFDKIQEEWLHMQDIKNLVWNVEWEELKKWFLKILEDHYNDIIKGDFKFNNKFWDGPLHIALTYNPLEETKWYCDTSWVSWRNELTKKECYGYIYQFRATQQNNFCKEIDSNYQERVCEWFLQYTSYLDNN